MFGGAICMKLNDIISLLKTVYDKFDNIRLGIAGSYANGNQTDYSDIDIVIDGDSMRVDIMEYIKNLFNVSVDILWVDLMKKEDEELDNFALENELPINQHSVYKTVMREVIWV
jgi:predicted nucleotidyltransferase